MHHRCNSRTCKRCYPPCPSTKFDDIYKYLLTKEYENGLCSPLVYSFLKKRRKSSTLPETVSDEEPSIPQQDVEEVVVPAENVKVLKNGEEQKDGGDLCSTCHPPTVRVVFIKKQRDGRKKSLEEKDKDDDRLNNLIVCAGKYSNYYGMPPTTENGCTYGDKIESAHSYKSRYSVITACAKKSKPQRTGYDLGHYHGACGSSSDSDYEDQCTCVGPAMPCPGVTNRTRYCQCSSGRQNPVYCDDCAESEGLVPGYAQHPVVYCDCIDFENPKYSGNNMVFPHGRGYDGLCKQCAAEDTDAQWQMPLGGGPDAKRPKKKKKKKKRKGGSESDAGTDGKGSDDDLESSGRRKGSKRSSSKDRRKGKKSNKKDRKRKRGDKGKQDKDDGCCRRGLLRFVSRSSGSSN